MEGRVKVNASLVQSSSVPENQIYLFQTKGSAGQWWYAKLTPYSSRCLVSSGVLILRRILFCDSSGKIILIRFTWRSGKSNIDEDEIGQSVAWPVKDLGS